MGREPDSHDSVKAASLYAADLLLLRDRASGQLVELTRLGPDDIEQLWIPLDPVGSEAIDRERGPVLLQGLWRLWGREPPEASVERWLLDHLSSDGSVRQKDFTKFVGRTQKRVAPASCKSGTHSELEWLCSFGRGFLSAIL